jgi:hypothetical protein
MKVKVKWEGLNVGMGRRMAQSRDCMNYSMEIIVTNIALYTGNFLRW